MQFPQNTDRAAGISCRSKHNMSDLSLAGAATSIIFVMTKVCLLRHNFYTTNLLLLGQHVFVATKHVFCRDKSIFVTTKVLSQQAYSCYNKRCVLLQQTCVFCDKHMFVVTKLLLQQKYLWQLPPMIVTSPTIFRNQNSRERLTSGSFACRAVHLACRSFSCWAVSHFSAWAPEISARMVDSFSCQDTWCSFREETLWGD